MPAQLVVVVVVAAALLCLVPSIAALSMPVMTQYGPISGLVGSDYLAFKGIPYAKPPLGALRWKAPQPPTPWTTPLNATRYSKICSQPVWDFFPPVMRSLQSEDCLYMNIWTPKNATASSKLPVMLWYHPGGNFKGSALGFSGEVMSPYGNVVVVTINYRLGIMGFMVTEGMLLESPKLNYGMQDQQEALRWVRNNIAAFGGDPARVTIAGESAGGGDVLLHLLMPESWPLYAAAISESPATPIAASLSAGLGASERVSARVKCNHQNPVDELACLRKAPVQFLVGNASDAAGVVIDNVQLFDQPLRLFAQGKFNKNSPLLSGTCAEEGNVLTLLTEGPPPMDYNRYVQVTEDNWGEIDAVEFVTAEYASVAKNIGYWQAVAQAQGDGWINCYCSGATNNTARLGTPTYRYLWTHIPVAGPWIPPSMNATHSVELSFVFGEHEEFTPAEAVLSRQTMSYWVSFMTCGSPNGCKTFTGEPRPQWPLFNPDAKNTILVLDTTISTTTSFRDPQCDAWNYYVWFK